MVAENDQIHLELPSSIQCILLTLVHCMIGVLLFASMVAGLKGALPSAYDSLELRASGLCKWAGSRWGVLGPTDEVVLAYESDHAHPFPLDRRLHLRV